MVTGYLLREVINKVNEIHFTSKEEIHTLGHLYETMLREMRDAAGDSGEFYTPRPVVKFIVRCWIRGSARRCSILLRYRRFPGGSLRTPRESRLRSGGLRRLQEEASSAAKQSHCHTYCAR